MSPVIFKYIKRKINGRNTKVGVVLAVGRDKVGWSLCNVKMGDKYDHNKALGLAMQRALDEVGEAPPLALAKEVTAMTDRAIRYFKN